MTDLFIQSGADISACGKYRYSLFRLWDESLPVVNWVMLNPSTATAEADDPTIRRCMAYARDWGYGKIIVTNLFAFRATKPRDMKKADDPIGPGNNFAILREAGKSQLVVCGWGNDGDYLGRGEIVREILFDYRPKCLGLNENGQPKHPLFLAKSLKPIPYGVAS